MKKVLFVATVDSHIELFHKPYLKNFKEKGYQVHVATNSDKKIQFCDIKHRISIKRSPYHFQNIKAIYQLRKIIQNEQFNIIHCHTPMGSVVARLASRKLKKSLVIYTAHGFFFYKGAPLRNWFLYYPVEKYLAKYTDKLITINQSDYKLAKKKKFSTELYYVPGVGLDFKEFQRKLSVKQKEVLRKSLGITKQDYVLIYPAELSKRKNQIMLIKVMDELVKKNKNIKLLLPGVDSLNKKHQKIIERLNLTNNILLLGFRKDISKLLQIANTLVSTSKQEGLPFNILEGIVMGLPIVATNCRGNKDLLVPYSKGYLVDINDIKKMVYYIECLIKNKKIYHQQTQNNLEIFRKYNLENVLIEMEKIYELDKTA